MSDEGRGLDRAVSADLERLRVSASLARQESSFALAKAMDEVARPLDVAEISSVLDRLESPVLTELRGLLDGPSGSLDVRPDLLADLLRDGVEGQAVLKRGLTFLKHQRYAEAAEWWSLNRRGLDPVTSRLSLLLLIMESLTHLWAGDTRKAAALAEAVRGHKLYRAGPRGPA